MSIKSLTYRLSLLLAVCALMLTSCGNDDDVVIDDVDGINVADGLYMSKTGVDPVTSQVLAEELVEAEGIGATQTRTGFLAGYIYLEAGDYNMYQIESKEITATFGGTAETLTAEGDNCGNNDYILITAVEDGAAVNVATAGLYKVTYDTKTGEALLYEITNPGIIGDAANGWNLGDDITFPQVNATASGVTWSVSDVELRKGSMKIRFNCRWTIDRRITQDNHDEDNGYVTFTNFGGTSDNPVAGGDNFVIETDQEGIYTVDVSWTPEDQWKINLTKTGDVDPIVFNPDENKWAVVGDAIADDGWDNDADMTYSSPSAGTHTWSIDNLTLRADKGFKFRTNDNWDDAVLGWGQVTLDGDTADFSDDNGNIKVATEASYDIELTTTDGGDTYTATFTKL